MNELAFVCVVGLVSVVAIVAICFGRSFTGKANGDGTELSVTDSKR